MGIILSQLLKIDKYAQVSVKEGLNRHGYKTLHALLSEFGQIDQHDTSRI